MSKPGDRMACSVGKRCSWIACRHRVEHDWMWECSPAGNWCKMGKCRRGFEETTWEEVGQGYIDYPEPDQTYGADS